MSLLIDITQNLWVENKLMVGAVLLFFFVAGGNSLGITVTWVPLVLRVTNVL